jgi:phenylpropionate dioxygenase-like ring-hydroxylating dioxygenase large terminal subunit
MLSPSKNELLTRTGPGTAAGRLLRSYWLPVAVSAQLEQRNPMPVAPFGEKLALFRDASGRLGLIADRCAHRGTSLSAGADNVKTSGRIDANGLRCPYHGWLYDVTGQCRDQPGEPEGFKFCDKVKLQAYPVQEKYGFIWAFMGSGEPPELPPLDAVAREDGVRINTIGRWPCNYFQVLENLVDPVHVSVLHQETDFDQAKFQTIPTLKAEATAWGLKTIAGRPGYEREVEFLFPCAVRLALPIMEPGIQLVFWVVPVSDTEAHSFHSWFLPLPADMPQEEKDKRVARMKKFIYELDDSDPIHHASKVNVQDKFACYSQGEIADRTQEHLGRTDAGITLLRRLYFKAMEEAGAGQDPLGIVRKPIESIVRFDNVF